MPTNPDHKTDLSLEALADLQVPSDLKISPDGTKIAYGLRAFRSKTDHPKIIHLDRRRRQRKKRPPVDIGPLQ